MKRYLLPKGRFSRTQYWICIAIFFAACALAGLLCDQFSPPDWLKITISYPLVLPAGYVLFIGQIRRWHDRDKTAWWLLINLIPILGWLWSSIELGFLPGMKGGNRFGPDPLREKVMKANEGNHIDEPNPTA